jgi:hypothetical protein
MRESGKGGANVRLSTAFPKKFFDEKDKTLNESGIKKSETLIVEIK